MRIVTLLVRYGVEQYSGAVEKMEKLLGTLLSGCDWELLVIDNALPHCYEEIGGDRSKVIGGNNEYWEFSGWDRGVQYLGRELYNFDMVHLATSAFDTVYNAYLQRFSKESIALAATHAVAVGHIDFYPYPVRLGAFISQHWLRTSFLFLPPAEVRALGSMVTFRDKSILFSGDSADPFRAEAPISIGYRGLIVSWLTSADGTGQGMSWHSRFELNASTLRRFEDKTVAILNEHALSVRLRAQGCKLVDVTYLSGLRSQTIKDEWSIPGWRTQVVKRTDAAFEPGPIEPYR